MTITSEVDMKFRSLKSYKYQLVEDFAYDVGIPIEVDTPFFKLTKMGVLLVRKGYSWDGPSGPTIDTKSSLKASLVHDCLYQLIREGYLDMSYRKPADKIFYYLCVKEGMNKLRAKTWYKMLRLFGGAHIRKDIGTSQDTIYEI